MIRFLGSRKTILAFAIIVAFVAVVVPMYEMVGCSMEFGYMPFADGQLHFSPVCGGEWLMSQAPTGVVPAGTSALVLALSVVALFAGIVLMRPQTTGQLVRIIEATPPPPPEEPQGQRFRV